MFNAMKKVKEKKMRPLTVTGTLGDLVGGGSMAGGVRGCTA